MLLLAVTAWERIPREEQMLLLAVTAWERIPREAQMLLPALAAWGTPSIAPISCTQLWTGPRVRLLLGKGA
jgi:hypothetical protein